LSVLTNPATPSLTGHKTVNERKKQGKREGLEKGWQRGETTASIGRVEQTKP